MTKKEKCEKHFKNIINKYESIIDYEYKKKAKKLEKIVKEFIIKKGLILYGGSALDILLPKNNKIYTNDKLFDFDAYSSDPIKDGKELVDLLIKNKFKYVQLRQAMFTNDTFKVFVENIPACDITRISKIEYDKMKAISYTRRKMLIASPHILIKYMCMELSQPHLSYYRWDKVYERHMVFDKIYGINDNKLLMTITPPPDIEKVLKESLTFFKKHKIPIMGYQAIRILEGKRNQFLILDTDMSYLSCVSIDINKLVTFYKKKLDITIETNNTLTRIKYNTIYICDIFNVSDICVSICKKSDYLLVSLFGMKYFLYLQFIDNLKSDYIKYNISILNNLIKKTNCKATCLIDLECYGNGKSNMWEIRKMRWEKGIIIYKPILNNKANTIFNAD